uniref:Uncharacterized protein n=1 Tax=Oryza glumipatula TaxID=40148 RepID=A0A0E0AJP7_9ORYZ
MAVVVAAAYETAASDTDNARPRAGVDPQLLMAARRGDSKLLEEKLNDDRVEAAASEEAVVVVDVVPPPPRPTPPPPPPAAADVIPASSSSLPAAPPPPPPPPLPLDGVTAEGDTLLHVVAECGDGLEFRHCARLIYDYDREKHLLDAPNGNGDTPLHCAAAAGNAEMISCLLDFAAPATTEIYTEAEKKVAYLRVHNNRGETALHHAVRAAAAAAAGNKDKKELALDCINRLMAADPQLAAIPLPNEKAASPLYLAISLGEIDIAEHLFVISEGNLSCSGPNGRNVLHAAVSFPQGKYRLCFKLSVVLLLAITT